MATGRMLIWGIRAPDPEETFRVLMEYVRY